MSKEYKSILIPQTDNQAQHPSKQYCNIRQQSLQSLSDKYRNQINFHHNKNFNTDSNPRLQFYMGQYKSQQEKVQKQKIIRQAYLSSEEFDTIFGECIDQNRERTREQRQLEKMREQMRKKWVEHFQEPEHDESIDMGEQGPDTILTDYRDDPNKQKQLYLIDLQMGRLKFQQNIEKKVVDKRLSCQNQVLLSRMSKNILSSYMVNFDEIFKALIDDLLEEQVIFFNHLEANYHLNEKNSQRVNQSLSQNTNNMAYRQSFENYKTLEMMELVKQLEDLCDDDGPSYY